MPNAAILIAAVSGLSAASPVPVQAQGPGQVYERRDECIEARRLTPEQCEIAYRNARAEFERKAPRYAARGSCEKSHRRCAAQMVVTGGWESFGRGGAVYVPRFTGVRVTGEGAAMRALPVVEGAARIAFAARSVSTLDAKVGDRPGVIGVASRQGRGERSSGRGRGGAEREETGRQQLEEKRIGEDVAPGLYVDPDGVEWYKPARRR